MITSEGTCRFVMPWSEFTMATVGPAANAALMSASMADFCSATYGTTFPILGKIEVNGEGRHEIYESLVETPDAAGEAGDIQWNFEKFLIAPGGEVVGRFRPKTLPDADEVVAAIEAVLPR